MKKTLLVTALAAAGAINAQPWFAIIPQNQCYAPNTMYTPTVIITATVPGATSYSWTVLGAGCTPTMYTNPAGYGGMIAQPCTGTGTLTGYAINGSSTLTSQTSTYVINSAPPVNISASPNNGSGCLGTTFTLVNSGANAGNSFTTTGPGVSTTGSMVVFTPSSSASYTVIATAPSGCTASAVQFITISQPPNITVSSNTIGCGSVMVTPSGAQSYTWSNGSSLAAQNFAASGCYTVIGANSGCSNTSSAVICVSVNPNPSVSIMGSTVVCYGSSHNFSIVVFGMNNMPTYTWVSGGIAPSSINASISYTAAVTHTLGVVATDTITGCQGSYYVMALVDTACAIVWPGDANSDGTVSSLDVLELGLYANSTGASRSGASNSWTGQYATVWTGLNSNSKNRVHVDCNGDGTVNTADTAAISQNFSMNHSFKVSGSAAADPDLSLVPQSQHAYPGIWNKVDVIAGSASTPLANLYGLAFEVNYNSAVIESHDVKMLYTASFLNANNQTIDFGKRVAAGQKVYAATVRTNQVNVNGHGKIGEVWFRTPNGLPNNTTVSFGVSNASAISASGNLVSVTSGNTSMLVNNNVSGLSNLSQENNFTMYPNPARRLVRLLESSGTVVHYSVSDITGRRVAQGVFSGAADIDVSAYSGGIYMVTIDSASGQLTKKLVVAD
jgi:hypothetical protein